jgi:hypothetical protein
LDEGKRQEKDETRQALERARQLNDQSGKSGEERYAAWRSLYDLLFERKPSSDGQEYVTSVDADALKASVRRLFETQMLFSLERLEMFRVIYNLIEAGRFQWLQTSEVFQTVIGCSMDDCETQFLNNFGMDVLFALLNPILDKPVDLRVIAREETKTQLQKLLKSLEKKSRERWFKDKFGDSNG